jgi:cyclophilin family peptidyl-prolyl cis-trans isomerase/HEAT repeat protein
MYTTCSSRRRIRFVSRSCVLPVVLLLAARPVAAQGDEGVVEALARLLAAADARAFDAALARETLVAPDPFVRRQAALAAGRSGDTAAVALLVATLRDSSAAVQAAAAFALGLLKDGRAVAPLAALARTGDGAPQCEAVTAIAKIGGDEGARAVADLLDVKTAPGVGTSAVQRVALLEAWRLGTRAPVARLTDFARDPDPAARAHAVYSLARLRIARAVPTLLGALADREPYVRAVALRGVTRVLSDSAQIAPPEVIARIRPLLGDRDGHVRVNALRALASFQDSGLVGLALPLVADRDVNVVVQAETTLGALGGARAAAQLEARLASPRFALRRQAGIALAQADSAAGVAAAAELARDHDWRWRSVAAEAFGAARDRARLELQLADSDGRVVAQALQALGRVVAEGDTSLAPRARALLAHPDAAVRSVAADLLARHPALADVDALATAYERAAADSFPDARLSAVAALGAIAATGAEGRLAVATRFVARTPRPPGPDDYLVRRLAAQKLPDAAARWGPAAPIATGRSLDDYRAVVRRYLLPVRRGDPSPRVTIETARGAMVVELFPGEAPLTVAAFLALVDRRFFDDFQWHRVVPNFVVQDGDPRGDGWGGPGFVLRDELNPVRYETGTMGMALSGPDTGGSQFFITHSPQPHLDGTYTVFGRVISGLATLGSVAQGELIRTIHRSGSRGNY